MPTVMFTTRFSPLLFLFLLAPGWLVGQDRRLTPLVIDPRAVDEDGWVILHPDGRVETEDGRNWPHQDDWLQHERQRRRNAA